LQWGRGRSPGPRTAALWAWPVPWTPYSRRGGVACILNPVRPPWGRGRSPGLCIAAWGVDLPLGTILPPWGRGRSPGPSMAALGAWPVPWAPYGRREGVSGPLCPVWSPWGRGRSLCTVWTLWGRGRSPRPRMATVGACPVPWTPYGRRGSVAGLLGSHGHRGGVPGPLGPVWPSWGRARSPRPRMVAVGARPVPWAPYGRRGGVPGPLCPWTVRTYVHTYFVRIDPRFRASR